MPMLGHQCSDDSRLLSFPSHDSSLHHLMLPGGKEGLLLQFGDPEASARLRNRAITAGFKAVTANGNSLLRMQDRVTSESVDEIAMMMEDNTLPVGGRLIPVNRSSIFEERFLSHRAGKDIPALALLGTNHQGEDVFSHQLTGRVRKMPEPGGYRLAGETHGEDPTLYLRAGTVEDLPGIAMGLLKRAERGLVSQCEFGAFMDAVIDGCDPEWGIDRPELSRKIKVLLARQVLGIVSEDSGSRESYHRAVRIHDHLGGLMEFDQEESEGFIPTLKFLILLKRLVLEFGRMEFSGTWQLGLAMPGARCDRDAELQVIDMTGSGTQGLPERVMNCLGNRQPSGVSHIIISGRADSDAGNAIRYAAGRSYMLDIVAEFEPHLATGRHGSEYVTMFIVGDRRANVESSLPEAARRTFNLSAQEDFDRLYTEILRSRKQIRKWILDQDDHDAGSAFADMRSQRPYIPLSRVSAACTMIPKSLEGATAKALRRVSRHFEPEGGVDAGVGRLLGLDTDALGEILTSEQVDAVAMCQVARVRNRAFLLADQTGIGKGRTLATIARHHIRAGGRVIYFTENAEINIPDVWRDIKAVGGMDEAVPTILASRPVTLTAPDDEDGTLPGFGRPRSYRTMPAAERKVLFASGEWPEGSNIILTNYSLFRGKVTSPSREWSRSAIDEDVLVVLDESQNALNPQSNTGASIRDIMERIRRSNVVFATATPMRDQFSAHLYHNLLPDSDQSRLDPLLSTHLHGGEIAQESFTTMLAEDGVFLRRDHDLSNIDFQIRLPDDRRIGGYREIMDRFSPMVEAILECSLTIGDIIGDNQGRIYRRLIEEGFDPEAAAAETTALSQYSHSPGGALSRLSRLLINAIKIDQVVDEVMNELHENRKPLVTFHSTGNELFKELVESGTVGEGGHFPGLTLADQIRRVAESIFRVNVAGEIIDARTLGQEITDRAAEIERMIENLPGHLPASPLDALIEKLEAAGLSTGEISGRQLVYRDGYIVRRPGTGRRDIVDSFNDGSIDVLIYNMAGATGGSYHAAPEFRDQRPRSLVEMETPLDIIKYVQAQGRSNRYGQVARPRIVSVMTGLIPEMRILQQRNCKLRTMGASVDGNRSHPLLLDDIPDFLNIIGDRAVRQVLAVNQDITRRLGFAADNQGDEADAIDLVHNVDINTRTSNSTQSIANKVLSRSIVLTANDQTRLLNLVKYEFDALVEELDSKDANPLRTRELSGEIEIRARTLYSGIECIDESFDTSAFFAPLYLSTGIHRFTESPITGDELQHMVERSRIRDGNNGFADMGQLLQQNFQTYLQSCLRPGTSYAEAVENLDDQPYRFKRKYEKYKNFLYLLNNIRPGRVINYDDMNGQQETVLRTIVRLISPEPRYVAMPQAYKIHTVSPGHSRVESMSLSRLLNRKTRFSPGLDLKENVRHLEEFSRQSRIEQSTPVQILTGNLLEAIELAKCNRLGSMSLYRESNGKVNRGIIIRKQNIDLRILPVTIPTVQTARSLVSLLYGQVLMARDAHAERMVMWTGDRDNPEIYLRFGRSHAMMKELELEMFLPYPKYVPGRTGNKSRQVLTGFYADKQELHDLMWVQHYNPHKHGYGIRRYVFPHDRELLDSFFECLKGTRIFTDGVFRESVNTLSSEFERGNGTAGVDLSPYILAGWA